MKPFRTFFIAELRGLCLHPSHLISLMMSIATILLLLHFGMGKLAAQEEIMPVLLLAVLVVTFVNVTQDAFIHDKQEGRMVHWAYSSLDLEWVVVCKWLAYVLSSALPIALIFAAIVGHGAVQPAIFSIFFATSVVILSCGMVAAALAICFEANQLMGYVLTIPFNFSVMIFAAEALQGNTTTDMGGDILLYALALILTPLCLWITSKLLKLGL